MRSGAHNTTIRKHKTGRNSSWLIRAVQLSTFTRSQLWRKKQRLNYYSDKAAKSKKKNNETQHKAFSCHINYYAVQIQHIFGQAQWCLALVSKFKGVLSLPGWLWELIAGNVKSFGEGIGDGSVSTQVTAALKSTNASLIHRNWKWGLNYGHLIKSRAKWHAELHTK